MKKMTNALTWEFLVEVVYQESAPNGGMRQRTGHERISGCGGTRTTEPEARRMAERRMAEPAFQATIEWLFGGLGSTVVSMQLGVGYRLPAPDFL